MLEPNTRSRKMFVLLLAWSFLLLGTVMLVGAAMIKMEAKAAEDWLSTAGTIIQSDTRAEIVSDGRHNTRIIVPDIAYTYRVGERDYRNNKIQISTLLIEGEQARQYVEKYPIGTEVEVFYDPANPAYATLEVGAPVPMLGPLIVGGMFAGFGLLGLKLRYRFYAQADLAEPGGW